MKELRSMDAHPLLKRGIGLMALIVILYRLVFLVVPTLKRGIGERDWGLVGEAFVLFL